MGRLKVSERLSKIPASPIRKLASYAIRARKKGIKIIHLNIGDPDIKSPAVIINSLKNWQQNPISYANSQGEEKLIRALVWYYHNLGFKFIKNKHLQITLGGSEAILMTFLAIVDFQDEIIVFEPTYPNYFSLAACAGVKLVAIKTDIKYGFHLPNKSKIEQKITKKTKAILICNPNNPSGTIYTKKEIKLLVSLAKKHNLYLIADEVYREFCYQGKKHVSLLNYMKELPDRIIVLDSLSKRYSICGLRLGCLVSLNKEINAGVLRIAQGRLSAGKIDQLIASKLTQVSKNYFVRNINEYQKRRDFVYNQLLKVDGVTAYQPEGAFYLMVGLPVRDSEDFCRWLLTDFHLNRQTLMLAPGAGFYISKNFGKNEVRIAYVLNRTALKKGLEIFKEGLRVYLAKLRN